MLFLNVEEVNNYNHSIVKIEKITLTNNRIIVLKDQKCTYFYVSSLFTKIALPSIKINYFPVYIK